MLDRFNRSIEYMRVAVTDRCDLRCGYCMPPDGAPLNFHKRILSYEQITAVVTVAAAMGIKKIRLTGGEPLVRRDIEDLVAMLSPIPGVEELCMTTNGTRLPELAQKLKESGMGRLNISLDSLDSAKYKSITGGGRLEEALAGVDAALAAGLTPVKINMVVLEDTTTAEIEAMREYCDEKGAILQLISRFTLEHRDHGVGAALTDRPPACSRCDRLRLTADGHLKPCLFSEDEIAVDFDDIRGSLLTAVDGKPQAGTQCRTRPMHAIGG